MTDKLVVPGVKEQKYLRICEDQGASYNFFFWPDTPGSLEHYLTNGWRILFMRESSGITVIVLERS